MTVSNSFIQAQQLYANKEGQSKRNVGDNSSDQSANQIASFNDIAQQMLSLLDTDKGGSIDKTEFSQAAQAIAKISRNADTTGVDAAFAKADTNNNGQISSDEFMNALKLAADQIQKKHHSHKHHSSNMLPQAESALPSSTMDTIQKNLLAKIMDAYTNPTSATGSTTNISV